MRNLVPHKPIKQHGMDIHYVDKFLLSVCEHCKGRQRGREKTRWHPSLSPPEETRTCTGDLSSRGGRPLPATPQCRPDSSMLCPAVLRTSSSGTCGRQRRRSRGSQCTWGMQTRDTHMHAYICNRVRGKYPFWSVQMLYCM